MLFSQTLFLIIFGLSSLMVALWSLRQTIKGNTNQEVPWLFPWGAFVWADGVILGLFWVLVSILILFVKDWILFWLICSVFWLVRSLGEIIYWLNEQFAETHLNPPQKYWFFKYFPTDAVWFVFQLVWQCGLVFTLISTVWLFSIWLSQAV
ncbi:MAG TPA: hypothetical protein PLM16_00790 [Candidatus Woesebacteria bacterium]|nr:hypothetical protein [Candidatus Woesebacteria bacterium]